MINDDSNKASLMATSDSHTEAKEDEMFDPKSTPPSLYSMFKMFVKLSVPAMCTAVLFWMCNVILVVYAGLLGDPKYVAIIGISWTCCSLMVLSFLIGLNAA